MFTRRGEAFHYLLAAGTGLNFSGGTRNLEAGSDVSGAGTLFVSGATVNANGSQCLAGRTNKKHLLLTGKFACLDERFHGRELCARAKKRLNVLIRKMDVTG